MKKIWLITCTLAVLVNWQCRKSDQVETRSGEKPNIIFILADDLRFDALGYTGNKLAITPNLDALAAKGTNFKNTYVTSSICAISRASILTGQYARRHGVDNFDKSLSSTALQLTYPGLLRGKGYFTGFIGKYGVGKEPPSAAFDYWKGYSGHGSYFFTDPDGTKVHETAMMGRQAKEFINQREKSKPFCLSISLKAPHSEDGVTENNGFRPDPYFNSWYNNVAFPYPATYTNDFYLQFPEAWRKNTSNVNNEARVRWGKRFSTPEKFQSTSRAIYRLVSGIDKMIGELREFLKSKGLDKNTILVFTSDNGYYMGEHGLEGKWYGHEESIRVPLIVYDPRMSQQRKVVEEMTLNIDIAPTILSWAEVDVPYQMQGKRLQPLMSGSAGSWREDFFYEHSFHGNTNLYIPKTVGLVTPSWKYMRYYTGTYSSRGVVYEELYNVVRDRNETLNRVNDIDLKERIHNYKKKVAQYEHQLR